MSKGTFKTSKDLFFFIELPHGYLPNKRFPVLLSVCVNFSFVLYGYSTIISFINSLLQLNLVNCVDYVNRYMKGFKTTKRHFILSIIGIFLLIFPHIYGCKTEDHRIIHNVIVDTY